MFSARGSEIQTIEKVQPPPTSSRTTEIVMQQIDQLVLRDIHLLLVLHISVVHLYCVKNIRVIPLSNKWKLFLVVLFAKTVHINNHDHKRI